MITKEAIILGCDIDNTLVPTLDQGPEACEEGYEALDRLCTTIQSLQQERLIRFGSITGRTKESHAAYEQEVRAFGQAVLSMDFKVTSVGTAVEFRRGKVFRHNSSWPGIDDWGRFEIQHLMSKRRELQLQSGPTQNKYKLSYDVTGVPDSRHNEYVAELEGILAEHALRASIAFSAGQFLDFLPEDINKGSALRYVADHQAHVLSGKKALVKPVRLAAGDSMNDTTLLAAADFAILPSNAYPSLKEWATQHIAPEKLHIAERKFAAGVLEGLLAFTRSQDTPETA